MITNRHDPKWARLLDRACAYATYAVSLAIIVWLALGGVPRP